MTRINWKRVLLGGLIASVIAFVTDGLLHERLLANDWRAVYSHLSANPDVEHGSLGIAYFAIFELGRGMVSIFLYALMRSHFGAGARTAVVAGIVTWLAFSIAGPAQFIPLGFFSNALWFKAGAFQLVTSILAAIAGAALYKEDLTQK